MFGRAALRLIWNMVKTLSDDEIMVETSSDEIILRYNGAVLRQSDLVTLEGPKWLNDDIIQFYFKYLSSFYPSEHILLVPPAISYWIMNCQRSEKDTESLGEFLKPLNLPSKKLIIFPVNNNDNVAMPDGGTHWSLLAYERTTDLFIHHDSLDGMNMKYAKCLYQSLVPYTGVSDQPRYMEYEGSPQDNDYDCGLFVLATAKVICSWFDNYVTKDEHYLWFSRLGEEVNAFTVSRLRSEILELIESLRQGRSLSHFTKGADALIINFTTIILEELRFALASKKLC